jgi:hypothetical protein
METTPSFTLAEIKKALTKHNKELNNDIKVRITPDGIKFSSAKAEEIAMKSEEEKTALQTEVKETKKQALQNLVARDTYKPPEKPKKPRKKMVEPDPKQPSILDKLAKVKK